MTVARRGAARQSAGRSHAPVSADVGLLRLCAKVRRQARAVDAAIAVLVRLERADPASCAKAEARLDRLAGTHRRSVVAVCAVRARTASGLAAKARVARAWLDTSAQGGPFPHADPGAWLGWSLSADVLGAAL